MKSVATEGLYELVQSDDVWVYLHCVCGPMLNTDQIANNSKQIEFLIKQGKIKTMMEMSSSARQI